MLDYIHGKPAINSLRHFMAGQSEAAIRAEFRWLEQLEAEDTAGVQAIAGAHALLATLNALDIPWAIVTSDRSRWRMPSQSGRFTAAGSVYYRREH